MKRGDLVAEFNLPDQTGTNRSLSELLADGPIVLFFYPAAMTPGCTKEACHFRDLASEFAAVGASRVGISTDSDGVTYRTELDLRDPVETMPFTTYYTSGRRPEEMARAVNDWLGHTR